MHVCEGIVGVPLDGHASPDLRSGERQRVGVPQIVEATLLVLFNLHLHVCLDYLCWLLNLGSTLVPLLVPASESWHRNTQLLATAFSNINADITTTAATAAT